MHGEDFDDVGRSGVPDFNAVRDRQVHGPALVLDVAIEVAHDAFLAQLGRHGSIQGMERAFVFKDFQMTGLLVHDLHFVSGQLEDLSAH